ncbi:TIGR03118 family protein [Granulicella sp. S190]|uniref:TIGR03118 family protein n=1 Tax=Granulicella sp. S190 TaxID=1747226 RepID=UPI0020B136B3|nr:TIGR03118 family protein [Granulicella sp. S190]
MSKEAPAQGSSSKGMKGRSKALLAVLLGGASLCASASAQTGNSYRVTNIISDGSVTATTTDPNLINPWGLSAGGAAFWISGEKTGFEIVSAATGAEKFDVNIPAATGSGPGQPTEVVFAATAKGFTLPIGAPPTFLFATHDGAIAGWNAVLGMNDSTAQIVINNSATNASYTGMALLNNSTGTFLLAANFGQASDIEVYNTSFQPAKLSGNFTDPKLPANYSPFSVHVIGDQVYVAYALRSTTTTNGVTEFKQTVQAGAGILDIFDLNGNFVATAVNGGNLNAPWGVAVAPSGFGVFGGDLLVGNFGDGIINAYNPTTYAFLGQITDSTGKAVANLDLWEIVFGQSNATPAGAGDPNTLFFAAGLTGAAHGLVGSIASATSTSSATFGFSASTSATTVTDGSSATATLSVVPTNGFTGNVALSCSGPVGVTCTFPSPSLAVSATAVSTENVTIQTTGSAANRQPHSFWHNGEAAIATALLLPFGSILAFSWRRNANGKNPLRLLGVVLLSFTVATLVVGCSSSPSQPATSTNPPPPPSTPTGTQQVTITATSAGITQTANITLTVQ